MSSKILKTTLDFWLKYTVVDKELITNIQKSIKIQQELFIYKLDNRSEPQILSVWHSRIIMKNVKYTNERKVNITWPKRITNSSRNMYLTYSHDWIPLNRTLSIQRMYKSSYSCTFTASENTIQHRKLGGYLIFL